MLNRAETDLRRRSTHLRRLAYIRKVAVVDGSSPVAIDRGLHADGMALDVALDRGGDILRPCVFSGKTVCGSRLECEDAGLEGVPPGGHRQRGGIR